MPDLEHLIKQVEDNRHHLPAQAVNLDKNWQLCFYASGQDARTFSNLYDERVIHNGDVMVSGPIDQEELKERLVELFD